MKRNDEIKNKLIQFCLPQYNEIPDVGLYLDQVSKYMNTYLSDFKEICVTPSMISNYVKQKLVARVQKKAYSRDQVACLFFVAIAKTVLSMDEIRTLMQMYENQSHEVPYAYFCDSLKESIQNLFTTKISNKPINDENKQLMQNITTTIAHKMYLEKYFEFKKSNNID